MRLEIENRRDDLGYARVQMYETYEEDGKVFEYPTYMGLVDKNGKQIVSCKYHNIIGFYNNAPLACVELNRKYGYVDTMGNEIVSCQYSFAEDCFTCGLAMVARDDKYGFVDACGHEVITCKYEDAHVFIDNLSAVSKCGRWGVIDKNESIVVPMIYDYINIMGNERICVCKNDKYGMLNYFGKVIVCCEYDGLSSILSDGRVEYKKQGEHGFMDLNGNNKEILPF